MSSNQWTSEHKIAAWKNGTAFHVVEHGNGFAPVLKNERRNVFWAAYKRNLHFVVIIAYLVPPTYTLVSHAVGMNITLLGAWRTAIRAYRFWTRPQRFVDVDEDAHSGGDNAS